MDDDDVIIDEDDDLDTVDEDQDNDEEVEEDQPTLTFLLKMDEFVIKLTNYQQWFRQSIKS